MESGELEAQIRAMVEEGRAAWPALRVDPVVFAACVEECMASGEGNLHVGDLYLACACARAVPGAVEALEAAYRSDISDALRRFYGPSTFGDEVRQIVLDKLFVGKDGKEPKIVKYKGRGPLATWIRTSVGWTAKDLLRKESVRERVSAAALSEALPVGADPEIDYLKARYRVEFREALKAEIASLPVQDRLILKYSLVQRLSHDEIAHIYGVTQPTITRRIARMRETIASGIQRGLRERLRLGASDVQSLAKLVLSQLDLSLAGWLSDDDKPRKPS